MPFARANASDKDRPRWGIPENGPAIGLCAVGLASRCESIYRCSASLILRGPILLSHQHIVETSDRLKILTVGTSR
jgi:hypothetical protein